MVMDYLPHSRYATIDVRDSLLYGDLLPGKLKLPMLDAHFVSHISSDLDELIFQSNLPV